MWFKRGHKYGAKRTECEAGHLHASKLEARVCNELTTLLSVGAIHSLEQQVRYPLVVLGVKLCTMIPDFRIVHHDRSTQIVEAKGFQTPEYKLKRKLFSILHPNLKYTIISKVKEVEGINGWVKG